MSERFWFDLVVEIVMRHPDKWTRQASPTCDIVGAIIHGQAVVVEIHDGVATEIRAKGRIWGVLHVWSRPSPKTAWEERPDAQEASREAIG